MNEKGLSGVSAPDLADDYVSTERHNKERGLEGITAPVFEETYISPTKSKEGSLDDVSAPAFEDTYSDKKSSDSTKTVLSDIKAPVVEDTYNAPDTGKQVEKDISDIKAPVLEDEYKPEYKPSYVDNSLEEAKKEARLRSLQGSLNEKPANFDEKKSLDSYKAFMEERKADLAVKGGKKVIILTVLGILMSGLFYVFASSLLPFKPDTVLADKIAGYVPYVCIVTGATSLIMLFRSKFVKGFASFIFGLMIVLSLVVGGYILTAKSSFGLSFGVLLAVIAINVYISFTLNGNESVDLYYKHKA